MPKCAITAAANYLEEIFIRLHALRTLNLARCVLVPCIESNIKIVFSKR
jgi:hypothetical protein